jgi:hypothetical protein
VFGQRFSSKSAEDGEPGATKYNPLAEGDNHSSVVSDFLEFRGVGHFGYEGFFAKT